MDCCFILILLVFGFSPISCSHFPPRKYYYVDLKMNWSSARDYCRAEYTDLATIASMDDISGLQPAISYSWVWIGLIDDPKSWKQTMGSDSNSWRWSSTGEISQTGYHNWNVNEPNGHENCVIMGTTREWYDRTCEAGASFVCYTVTSPTEKTYHFFSSQKPWTEARDYCREHHTDLPTIESNEENSEVFSAKPVSVKIWIGLYRVPWTWSDKTPSSFSFWKSGSPGLFSRDETFCVAETALHEWHNHYCFYDLPFICHQDIKLKTMVRMKIKTDADITDPAISTQILQQLNAALETRGWTDFKLTWKIQPRKKHP